MDAKVRVSHGERRRRRREQILAAATRLLEANQSYTELSVEKVLREAGSSRATFYNHFKGKGELLSALSEEVILSMLNSAKPWWEVSGRPDEAALAITVTDIAAAYLERQTVMAAIVEVATYDVAVRAQLDKLVHLSIDALSEHIEQGQKYGFVDAALDAPRTAGWIVWMSERGLHRLVRTAGPEERRRYIKAWVHAIWNGLYTVCP